MTRAEARRIAARIRSKTATEEEVLSTVDLVAAALTRPKDQIFDQPPPPEQVLEPPRGSLVSS